MFVLLVKKMSSYLIIGIYQVYFAAKLLYFNDWAKHRRPKIQGRRAICKVFLPKKEGVTNAEPGKPHPLICPCRTPKTPPSVINPTIDGGKRGVYVLKR